MLRNFLVITSVIIMLASCGGKKGQNDQVGLTDSTSIQTTLITVAGFDSMAPNLVDKPVQIKGMVSHTCRHGGKRLFLIETDPDVAVEVLASDKITKFEQEIEGNDILVSGMVRELRIDEPYLSNWETELKEKGKSDNKVHKNHDPDKNPEGVDISAELEQIIGYRDQLKEAGVDHLSFFTVECESFDIIKTDTLPTTK